MVSTSPSDFLWSTSGAASGFNVPFKCLIGCAAQRTNGKLLVRPEGQPLVSGLRDVTREAPEPAGPGARKAPDAPRRRGNVPYDEYVKSIRKHVDEPAKHGVDCDRQDRLVFMSHARMPP